MDYLQEIAPEESLFRGECFVFDERVSLNNQLRRGDFALCEGCGNPVPQSQVCVRFASKLLNTNKGKIEYSKQCKPRARA